MPEIWKFWCHSSHTNYCRPLLKLKEAFPSAGKEWFYLWFKHQFLFIWRSQYIMCVKNQWSLWELSAMSVTFAHSWSTPVCTLHIFHTPHHQFMSELTTTEANCLNNMTNEDHNAYGNLEIIWNYVHSNIWDFAGLSDWIMHESNNLNGKSHQESISHWNYTHHTGPQP